MVLRWRPSLQFPSLPVSQRRSVATQCVLTLCGCVPRAYPCLPNLLFHLPDPATRRTAVGQIPLSLSLSLSFSLLCGSAGITSCQWPPQTHCVMPRVFPGQLPSSSQPACSPVPPGLYLPSSSPPPSSLGVCLQPWDGLTVPSTVDTALTKVCLPIPSIPLSLFPILSIPPIPLSLSVFRASFGKIHLLLAKVHIHVQYIVRVLLYAVH